MLDLKAEIARYPQGNGQSDVDLLRDKYPELGFFFDRVADDRVALEASADPDEHNDALDELATLKGSLTDLKGRFVQICDGISIIAATDIGPILKKNLLKCFTIADEAVEYIDEKEEEADP
jgi:hypothetical protein